MQFNVDYKEIKLRRKLGSGGSGSLVYLCEWKHRDVAFKCFQTTEICGDQRIFDEFEREVGILAHIAHPHIIKFFGAVLRPPRVGYLMEYCSRGDIDHYMQVTVPDDFPWEERIRIMTEIAIAQMYLHSRKIIHRDLKAENVLVADDLSTRLMDFGLSKLVDYSRATNMTASIGKIGVLV